MKSIFVSGLLLLCWQVHANEVKLPKCKIEAVVETPITFFISDSVIKGYEVVDIEGHIQRWLDFSNQALQNSCIPLTRTLDKIIFTPEILGEESEELSVVHAFLEYYYPQEIEALTMLKLSFMDSSIRQIFLNLPVSGAVKLTLRFMPNFLLLV